jgi:hypothetical protein
VTAVALTTKVRAPAERVRASVLAPQVAAALSELSGSELVVSIDLTVRRGPGRLARLRARHGVRGDRVTAVSTALTGVVEVARLDLHDWQAELARAVTVTPSETDLPPPDPGLLLPWDLLVGTGAARARHRPEVYDVLVARAVGSCRAGGRALDLVGCHDQLRRLHAATGRMRAVGVGPGGARPRVGWVSWLLVADGWLALTPTARDHRAMIRVEPRRPTDLAFDVAGWLAAVR